MKHNAPPYLSWLLILGFVQLSASTLLAWEGHKWDEWRQIETWQKPELHTDQSGRSDLVPLLGEGANRITSVAAWEVKRQQFASTIQQILGKPEIVKPPLLEVRELGVEELDGYTRRHIKIKTEPDDWIPAYLLVPKKRAVPRIPAMLCLHQTMPQGKDEICGISGDPEMAFAPELVKRGYVCIALDVIGFGERITKGKQPYDNNITFFRKHPAWSCMGKMNWDVGRVIDYLETLPFVDPNRIGSIGHSHGAYGTLFARAFDPRIVAAVASCGFTTFRSDPKPERWSHLTPLIPQLGLYLPEVASIPFDWQHVLALAAPRKLFVWYTTGDAIFPRTDNLDDLMKDVQNVYTLYGASNAITWRFADGPHKFPKAQREAAYDWLDENLKHAPQPPKTASAFFPGELVAHARTNAREQTWAAAIRDSLVAAARPWMEMSDDELWHLMFGNTIKRSWMVWSDGHCPSCKQSVPMYEWRPDALKTPWKMRCPRCQELFPKNDFAKFYRSGLDEQNVFDPRRADRSLLFNTEHPDPADPRHKFGVDDGDGYMADGKRWRFINAYLIFGQWKQAIVAGVHNLAAAYVATGDAAYAHKAAVLLDRIADLYPTMDFGKEGVMYEGPPRSGYVSTWHDACVEVYDLALAYDAIFEALPRDAALVKFLAAKAAEHKLANPKSSFADIQQNIEKRIFRDTLNNRPKIESNYPATDVTITTLHTVLGWPGNRNLILSLLDKMITKATAVDGVTGEKGLAGYATIGPREIAELLNWYARSDPDFIREMVRRHPRLHAMFRFHLDTWCLGQYYPRSGDTGGFAGRNPSYAGVAFSSNNGISPSAYAFFWELYKATGDKDFVRVLYGANNSTTAGLPYDLFAASPAAFQTNVAKVIAEHGAEIKLPSVNKTEWCLAILRSGEGPNARAAWLDYDSGERHGHADGMTIGLFAKGLDLLPDFGYPPVQYGGWMSPRARWYTQTAAHNTVSVDGQDTKPGSGKTTLWFDGKQFHTVRASARRLVGGQQFERTLALVDISEQDSYFLDVFRVVGGTNHTRFSHGHFGTLATQGLSPVPVEVTSYSQVMRNFRRDAQPAEGWSADWNVEDYWRYLPPSSKVHLRHTDLTRGAQVDLAESWVEAGLYGTNNEAWIPTVLVRREAGQRSLASTFASVLEPWQAKPNLTAIRRLELHDTQGSPCPDSDVGIEVRLADGRWDVFLSRDVEGASASGETVLVQKETGARLDGDLCLIRFAAEGQPERVWFCNGKSLQAGNLLVRAKNDRASFEIDLSNRKSPIVSGPASDVELIELAGVKLWPK